jgi:hypothetical protein
MKKSVEQEGELITQQFPEIDRLLETEDFNRINKEFTTIYEELEKATKGSGGLGKSSKTQEARKAMKAIERVMDLLRDLLKLKYQMEKGGVPTPQRKK